MHAELAEVLDIFLCREIGIHYLMTPPGTENLFDLPLADDRVHELDILCNPWMVALTGFLWESRPELLPVRDLLGGMHVIPIDQILCFSTAASTYYPPIHSAPGQDPAQDPMLKSDIEPEAFMREDLNETGRALKAALARWDKEARNHVES